MNTPTTVQQTKSEKKDAKDTQRFLVVIIGKMGDKFLQNWSALSGLCYFLLFFHILVIEVII